MDKPYWWPKNPYPASVFTMNVDEEYPKLVPDPHKRTGLSGGLGREFWDIASRAIWKAMQEAAEDGDVSIREEPK